LNPILNNNFVDEMKQCWLLRPNPLLLWRVTSPIRVFSKLIFSVKSKEGFILLGFCHFREGWHCLYCIFLQKDASLYWLLRRENAFLLWELELYVIKFSLIRSKCSLLLDWAIIRTSSFTNWRKYWDECTSERSKLERSTHIGKSWWQRSIRYSSNWIKSKKIWLKIKAQEEL